MKKLFLRVVLLFGSILALASGQALAQGGSNAIYQDGLHFFEIEQSAPLPPGTIEVVEVFSYMCQHCNTFEPFINGWLKRKPENIAFSRIPVVFGRKAWEIYARAYVTAQMMGIGDAAHAAMMDKLWKEKEIMRSMEELAEFYSGFGVDQSGFLATSKSFAVDARMRKEQLLTQTFGVRGTPTLVLNGKYRIAGNAAVPSFDVMLDVLDYLIGIEQDKAKETTAIDQQAVPELPGEGTTESS